MTTFEHHVCIIGGAGHIGLPTGVAFACAGMKTVLLDLNKESLERITAGVFPFKEAQGEEKLKEALQKGTLVASSDPAVIAGCKFIINVIGTPIDEYLNPNFLGIMRTVNGYIDHFRNGQIFVLRSTVYPGTSARIQRFFKEKNKDVRVAFCPERIVEGKAFEEFSNLPQIISSFDRETLQEVKDLFSHLSDKEPVVVEPTEAELSKLFCNAWRYIQFAVANQFFVIATERGLDYHRIYEGMLKDYPRMQDLPKPGFAAGPCLLKDTMQLAAFNNNNFFLGHTAMLVNEGLPNFVMQQIAQRCPDIADKTVGILGMAFKAESDDQRDSLSFKLRKIAATMAKDVLCHDPYLVSGEFVALAEVLERSDIIILATPHAVYRSLRPEDYPGKIFVDAWGVWGTGFMLNTGSAA